MLGNATGVTPRRGADTSPHEASRQLAAASFLHHDNYAEKGVLWPLLQYCFIDLVFQ